MVGAHALVLVSLADDHWNGQWRLTSAQRSELFRRIETDDETKAPGCGRLTHDDLRGFARKEESLDFVHGLPSSVFGLLNEALVGEVLASCDWDRSGHLDRQEWDAFLDRLESLHLKYLLKKSFQNFQAFYGRGQPWWNASCSGVQDLSAKDLRQAAGSALLRQPVEAEMVGLTKDAGRAEDAELGVPHRAVARRPPKTLQVGIDEDCGMALLPPGWQSDLWYYSSNNHPLHGIFASDPLHRLSRPERLAMELATISFTLLTVRLNDWWVVQGVAPMEALADPIIFNLVVVVIPGMLLWWLLFVLFTCPCAFVDKSRVQRSRMDRLNRCQRLSEGTAYLLVALGMAGLLWPVLEIGAVGSGADRMYTVFMGRLNSYGISWLIMVLVQFNPVVSWGQPDPQGPTCLGDYIGLGQWRVQKQLFQMRCLDALGRMQESSKDPFGDGADALDARARRRLT
mmetsp:Transcript_55800/g.155572  ORF Transcript_55800/g.155572 Transcript_55800/m.155572 type:complete len:456 (+) Transcript_55800:92-1459(+)